MVRTFLRVTYKNPFTFASDDIPYSYSAVIAARYKSAAAGS